MPCANGAGLVACAVALVLAALTLVGGPAAAGGARSATPASASAAVDVPSRSAPTPAPACTPRLAQCAPAGAPGVPAASWALGLSAAVGVAGALVVPGFRWRRRRSADRLPAGFAAEVLHPPRVLGCPY